jgi:hypothetical membrane protein
MTRTRTAGTLFLVAGLVYLAAETISAAAFPGYNYATNYISDLGVSACPIVYNGREICSPLWFVMSAGFIIQGALFIAAAVLARVNRVFLAFAVLYGIGSIMVGLFNETLGTVHVVGATLAIVCGNIAAIATRRLPLMVVGAVGLIGAILLETTDVAPDGVLERIAVYAITATQLVLGILLVRSPANVRKT